MKKKLSTTIAASVIALGMVILPATAASAAVKSGTVNCGSRVAAITASAPTNVSLTVDGVSASKRANGAAVTLYAHDGVGRYTARSEDRSVAVTFTCLPR